MYCHEHGVNSYLEVPQPSPMACVENAEQYHEPDEAPSDDCSDSEQEGAR